MKDKMIKVGAETHKRLKTSSSEKGISLKDYLEILANDKPYIHMGDFTVENTKVTMILADVFIVDAETPNTKDLWMEVALTADNEDDFKSISFVEDMDKNISFNFLKDGKVYTFSGIAFMEPHFGTGLTSRSMIIARDYMSKSTSKDD